MDYHIGEEMQIVIAGSGPSLDEANWDELPPLRIGINTALHEIPNCIYAAILDNEILSIRSLYNDKILLTTQQSVDRCATRKIELPKCKIIVKHHIYSVMVAIQHAIDLQVDKILFIGMDGGCKRAKRLKEFYLLEDDFYKKQHEIHHKMMLDLLIENGMNYEYV